MEAAGDEYATSTDNLLFNVLLFYLIGILVKGWTFEKNDTYWNAEDVKLEEVNYKLVQDAATRVNLYQTDKLDYAEVNAQFISQFSDSDELTTGELMSDMKFMRLNQEHEALANKKIRNAIYNAFDRQTLIDSSLLQNDAEPARFVVPADWAYDEQNNDFRDKDLR